MKNRINNHATRFSRLAVALVGLVACAAPSRNAESRALRTSASGYEAQILVDGVPAPTFWHDGESYVLGHTGQRYVIRILNHSGRRIEAVVTVDGRDVVDGKNGDFQHKRGYMVPAWGQVDIDGWRLSESQARPSDSRRSLTRTPHAPATHARSASSAWPSFPSASIVRAPLSFQRRRAAWTTIARTISVD
jgi:hypothetical protein